MDKHETLKALYELKNAFLAVLSHQFNLIKIEPNYIENINMFDCTKFLHDNNFPIYSGYIIEKLEHNKSNELIICEEIKKEKYCLESLNKIIDKMFFSIKSSNDFIEMLYLELKQKLSNSIVHKEFKNDFDASIDSINEKDKIIVIINNEKLHSKIYIYNYITNQYMQIVDIQMFEIANKYYCYMNISFTKLANFLIEKEV